MVLGKIPMEKTLWATKKQKSCSGCASILSTRVWACHAGCPNHAGQPAWHAQAHQESCWFSRPALDIQECLQDLSTIQSVVQALLCYRHHLYFQYAMNNNNKKAEFNKWDITCNLFHFYLLCMPVVFLNVFAVLNQLLKKSDPTNNYWPVDCEQLVPSIWHSKCIGSV